MEEMASHIKKEALASQSLFVFAKEIGPHEQRYIPQLREKLNDLQNANSLDRSIHIEFARKLNLIAQEILASQAILDQNLKPTNDLLTYLEKQPAQANQSDLYLSPEMIKASSQLQSNAELFAETQLNSSLRRFRDPIENELALKTQRESLETNKEINGELISSQKQYLKDAEPHLKNLLNELGQINKSYKTLQAHSSSLNTELSNLNAKLNPSNVSSYWSWFTSSSSSAAAPTQLEDLKEVEPALNSVASVVEDVKEKESTISKNVRRSYAEVVEQGYQILDDSFGAGLEEAMG
jgi:DNA repair exonuclease SbcCD ATPase subunit